MIVWAIYIYIILSVSSERRNNRWFTAVKAFRLLNISVHLIYTIIKIADVIDIEMCIREYLPDLGFINFNFYINLIFCTLSHPDPCSCSCLCLRLYYGGKRIFSYRTCCRTFTFFAYRSSMRLCRLRSSLLKLCNTLWRIQINVNYEIRWEQTI